MRIERLFNVLVLGGAALSGGCGDADDEGEGREPLGEGNGGAASGAGGAETPSGAGGAETPSGAGGAETPSGAGGTAASGGATGSGGLAGAGGATELECSTDPAPGDPCGCPCCWAEDCTNEEPRCEAFCAAGNDGLGCCPP